MNFRVDFPCLKYQEAEELEQNFVLLFGYGCIVVVTLYRESTKPSWLLSHFGLRVTVPC